MPPPPFSSPHNQPAFPALYLYPLNDTFVPKHIALVGGQRVKIGRQTNAKTVPAERNGYFDSKVLSRQHAEVWEENAKILIKDVKSSNGTFINGERLSPEGVESEPFELKNEDIVEFGIDIIGEDNKTTIHHKVAARVLCVLTEEDVLDAARVERIQNPPNIPGATSQPSTSAASSQFSFAQSQGVPSAQRRPTLQSQSLGGMGGMGGSMRPPGKSGLSFDHILSRLQSELQKSRETGAELHSLTTTMNDIHDTLGGAMPPNIPHFPPNLPPVRQPQSSPPHEPAQPQQTDSGSVPATVLSELRSQLHETQASLATHVDKVRALEDMFAEHEVIKAEVNSLREVMHERKRELEMSRHAAGSPAGHHGVPHHGDLRNDSYQGDDDDAASIHTIVPHTLERVEEEDEDQLVPEEEDEEERRRRREELGRPRTPEPTGMGMVEDEEDSPDTKHKLRSSSPLQQPHDVASAAIEDLAERLSVLSGRIDTAVEFNNSLQAQHTAAQTTISQLQSKMVALEELMQATQLQLQQQNSAQEAAQAEILKAVREPRESERESLTVMLNEWKKSVEGQWSAVQEEWSQERERLRQAKEEWESRARTLELGVDTKISAGMASLAALQRHDRFPNGDIKMNGGGLVTPPSPVSVASNPGRTKSRRRRSSSSRSRSRSSSPISSIEMIEGVVNGDHDVGSNPGSRRVSDQYQRSRSPSPSIAESEPESCSQVFERGAQYPMTPAPSVKDAAEQSFSHSSLIVVESKTEMPIRTSGVVGGLTISHLSLLMTHLLQLHLNMTTAVGVLVVGIATAAVLWRVKQD